MLWEHASSIIADTADEHVDGFVATTGMLVFRESTLTHTSCTSCTPWMGVGGGRGGTTPKTCTYSSGKAAPRGIVVTKIFVFAELLNQIAAS